MPKGLPDISVLATWPKPNYVNPENQTAVLLGTEISLIVLTTIVVALRVYTRAALTRSIGSDDWLMVAATVSQVVVKPIYMLELS